MNTSQFISSVGGAGAPEDNEGNKDSEESVEATNFVVSFNFTSGKLRHLLRYLRFLLLSEITGDQRRRCAQRE